MPLPPVLPGNTRGTVFRAIAELRIADAATLLAAGRYNGAIYLAGYGIECHLKYGYCERKAILRLPAKFETHSWDSLVKGAGLLANFKVAPGLLDLYSTLNDQWSPRLRYRTAPYREADAHRLYKEFIELYKFLRELIP